MAKPSLLSVCLCLLVLFHCCVTGNCKKESQQQQGGCQIERLNAREPQRRIEAEAGYTEFWDSDDDQFQCAGVAACRNVINPQGLLLPSYTSAPALLYVLQGKGFQGIMIPGCPETFQSSQQSKEGQSRRFHDQHQKIRNLREGDVIALPAGIAHWCYNNGEQDLVLLIIEDTSNDHNQLDNNPRKFFLAGNPQQQQQQQQQKKQQNQGNVLAGMDVDTLAEVFRVDMETASRLQGQDDRRGHIVRAESDLQVIRPQRTREEQEREERGYEGRDNGLEETICSARLRQNIDDPSRADFFNPRAGRLTILNSLTLPILSFLQLSAERGVLYRNAIMAPQYTLNAHSIIYATRGEAHMQIVDHRGQSVFNERIQEGQMVVVPQNFVVVKQAGRDGFEWVALKTNERAIFSTLAGHTSALRAIPVDVLANAYQISRDEAMKLKRRRDESIMFEASARPRRETRADA
ncbi:11S globulin seed storage protein Jug r 4-like [Camellia sinensis]|uniref:11S globulin seed storage protein Jug r 4-like n=1 Tax=Camellia sinensis TaxID=4442 RepID=UPI001035C907|nr:11S globulin seed storage protein Jug r 4-like [Camellia sinensis]